MWWIGSIAGLRCFGSMPRCGLVALAIAVPWRSRAELHPVPAHQRCATQLRIATATVDVMLRGTGLRDDQRAACHSNLNAYGLASNPSAHTTPSPSAPAGGLIHIYV